MGPLTGIKVIEIKGIGPGPYAGMLLADMGAEVIVVERSSTHAGIGPPSEHDVNSRGKKSIALNLKKEKGLQILLALVEKSDVLFEGFRPGVAERLGFGPEVCLARNPALVFGRITGWGQSGPLSKTAGHDINYISLTGSLAAIGTDEKPVVPLNLIGDYAGGSLFLVMGILAALLEAQKSGQGQVVDTAITDGSASLMSLFHTMSHVGQWNTGRQSNLLDGAAPFYDAYETADQKFVSIGSVEPQFYLELIERIGLDQAVFAEQYNVAMWPAMKACLVDAIKTKTRDEWLEVFEGTDACLAPVLDFTEAPEHPHNKARNTYLNINGIEQAAPAPRFSRTVCEKPSAPHSEGSDTRSLLADWGFSDDEISHLQDEGVLT